MILAAVAHLRIGLDTAAGIEGDIAAGAEEMAAAVAAREEVAIGVVTAIAYLRIALVAVAEADSLAE